MAYPATSHLYNQFHQSQAILTYSNAIQLLEETKYQEMLLEACEYNQYLLTKENRYQITNQEHLWYESCLNVNGPLMGYIDIKKINLHLPLYHGTSDEVLQQGIGHVEGTSLPVKQESVHCVFVGHSGLPSARLFTDLDQLEIGDTFQVHILNETLFYQVDQIKIVLPDEIDDLRIEKGKEYISLVTCTPYGINTHRLMIRAKRIESCPVQSKNVLDSRIILLFGLILICIKISIVKINSMR